MCCEDIFNDEIAQRPPQLKDLGNWRNKQKEGQQARNFGGPEEEGLVEGGLGGGGPVAGGGAVRQRGRPAKNGKRTPCLK